MLQSLLKVLGPTAGSKAFGHDDIYIQYSVANKKYLMDTTWILYWQIPKQLQF